MTYIKFVQKQTPNYLYEESLFFYSIINIIWYVIGISTLGFQFTQFSIIGNFILNFLWLGLISIIFCFPFFWYRLFFGKNAYLFKRQQVLEKNYDDTKQEYGVLFVKEREIRLLNLKEQFSLGFIFSVLLFDVFYSSVWVKNGILIWQPDWVLACVNWLKSHLTTPEVHGYWNWQQWDIFHLYFDDTTMGRSLKEEFGNEFKFLQNPVSNTLLFYHFIRTMLFIPIITAICIVLWQPFQLIGNSDKDPSNIYSIMGFIRACAWSIVMGFFGILLTYFLIEDVTIFVNFIRDGKNFQAIFGFYFFIALSVRFFIGWLFFWKRIIIQLFLK